MDFGAGAEKDRAGRNSTGGPGHLARRPGRVYLAGERRSCPCLARAAMCARPEEGEQVLVLKTGQAGEAPVWPARPAGRTGTWRRARCSSTAVRPPFASAAGYPADRRCWSTASRCLQGGLSVELMVRNGDYVSDGAGGFLRAEGTDELLQRVLWKLSIPRGAPLLPALGSELHRLGRAKPAERAGLARQYVAQALSDEAELSVAGVELSAEGELTVELDWRGEALRLILGREAYDGMTVEELYGQMVDTFSGRQGWRWPGTETWRCDFTPWRPSSTPCMCRPTGWGGSASPDGPGDYLDKHAQLRGGSAGRPQRRSGCSPLRRTIRRRPI